MAMLLSFTGCESAPPAHTASQTISPDGSLVSTDALTADQAVGSDQCSIQLHDICGALLLYYGQHKQLPEHLEDLKPLGDSSLSFVCPVSHLPYVYVPAGRIAPGSSKRIILFDPTPAHNGNRYCILMTMRVRPDAAQSLEVVPVSEKAFESFIPVGN
jgi:hypothetical protein